MDAILPVRRPCGVAGDFGLEVVGVIKCRWRSPKLSEPRNSPCLHMPPVEAWRAERLRHVEACLSFKSHASTGGMANREWKGGREGVKGTDAEADEGYRWRERDEGHRWRERDEGYRRPRDRS
jgi:hypothetical protein